MKKHIILCFVCIVIFILLSAGIAHAQDETEQVINQNTLLKTADEEIFKHNYFVQDFSEDQGYVNEFPNTLTVHQYYIFDGEGSDVLMTMQPSEEIIHTTNKRLKFDNASAREFHVTYSVARRENIPDGSGGICWIRYSNVLMYGTGRESGLMFYPGGKAYYFTPVNGEMIYTEIADLSDINADEKSSFDIIRLDGVTSVYVNGAFRFSFEDGIKDIVTFEGGSELFIEGNRIRCSFDDFSMRIK